MTNLRFSIKDTFVLSKTRQKTLKDLKLFLLDLMLAVEGHAKRYAPVDTGRLRSSIITSPKYPATTITVADGVKYGCVYGSRVQVNCGKNKSKTIGQVKIGDSVLTQDGLLHKVIGKTKYRAIEKPNLVEINTEYRNGKYHKLILTDDHKVLCKVNGCNKWVKSKDLKVGMILYSPKKINYNINKCEWLDYQCLNCNEKSSVRSKARLKYNKGVFCSSKCQKEYYKGNKNPNFGNKYSKQTKEKLSKIRKQFHKDNPDKHINVILSKKGYITNIDKQVKKWLDNTNIKYEHQKRIGFSFVDFYLPDLNVIIECDGAFWHKKQSKDIERDIKLKKVIPDVVIIHLHFTDYRFSKNIVNNPLDNVFYIQCNPSFNSFVNPNIFKEIRITKIKKFKYVNNSKNKGHIGTFLYDLSVDGMHSFVASGILISNSFQEFGTSRIRPQPFMRPALNTALKVDMPILAKKHKLK